MEYSWCSCHYSATAVRRAPISSISQRTQSGLVLHEREHGASTCCHPGKVVSEPRPQQTLCRGRVEPHRLARRGQHSGESSRRRTILKISCVCTCVLVGHTREATALDFLPRNPSAAGLPKGAGHVNICCPPPPNDTAYSSSRPVDLFPQSRPRSVRPSLPGAGRCARGWVLSAISPGWRTRVLR